MPEGRRPAAAGASRPHSGVDRSGCRSGPVSRARAGGRADGRRKNRRTGRTGDPSRPPLPDVRNAGWVRTPIDRFVLARLEKEGLSPLAEAPLETLVAACLAGPDRPAAVTGRSGRVLAGRRSATGRTRRIRRSSIACSRRRTMANDGRAPGSIWRAMPTRKASRRISRG